MQLLFVLYLLLPALNLDREKIKNNDQSRAEGRGGVKLASISSPLLYAGNLIANELRNFPATPYPSNAVHAICRLGLQIHVSRSTPSSRMDLTLFERSEEGKTTNSRS